MSWKGYSDILLSEKSKAQKGCVACGPGVKMLEKYRKKMFYFVDLKKFWKDTQQSNNVDI